MPSRTAGLTADLDSAETPTIRCLHASPHYVAAAVIVIRVIVGVAGVGIVIVVAVVIGVAQPHAERKGAGPKTPATEPAVETIAAETIAAEALSAETFAAEIIGGEGCAVATDCR